ncbi:hypothetical protein H632_c1609p0 [Helicosporidium sp. ATCC 50920]|nr:hypothetical protein H632_c1609p0 [Helicosporidium sp. ATCC 50920]|eukprot:KDD74059.1 hypothetical protein H632_c1609p0 [Helicosporidium sp. ATCC 50920]
MSASRSLVDQTIKNNKVVVFSKSYCPYCVKAKKALGKLELKKTEVFVMELDQRKDGDDIQDALLEITGGRSVPRVFIDGEFFGGGDDTEAAVRSGNLQTMLKDKGIF